MKRYIALTALACACAFGQAVIPGITAPSGAIDFASATTTKPVKAGTATPGTCGVGELYFETDATAGQNIWLCTATNTWTQVTGGGTTYTPGDNISIAGSVISATGIQNGLIFKCAATQATTQTCTMSPTVTQYDDDQPFIWSSTTTCSGSPTLNIDGVGAKNIYEADGTTAASCVANQPYWVIYNSSLNTGAGGFQKTGGGGSSYTPPVTTKGDIFTYSTTGARLAVGSDGQMIKAASGQTTGLQWFTPNRTKSIPVTPVVCTTGPAGVMANGWNLSSNTVGCNNASGNAIFAQGSNQAMALSFTMPSDWDGGSITLRVTATQTSDSTAPYAVRFRAEPGCTFTASTLTWSYGTAVDVDTTPFTNDVLHTVNIALPTWTSCTAGNPARIRFTRDVSVTDNAAASVSVWSAALIYTSLE